MSIFIRGVGVLGVNVVGINANTDIGGLADMIISIGVDTGTNIGIDTEAGIGADRESVLTTIGYLCGHWCTGECQSRESKHWCQAAGTNTVGKQTLKD